MISMNIFNEVKSRLDIVTVALDYGIKLDRNNKALSPFSNEKTPSFQVYPSTQSFYCYSSNQGGTVLDLVMKLTGLSLIETVKQLNEQYNLHIDLEKPNNRVEILQNNAELERKEAIKIYRKSAFIICSDYFKLLKMWKTEYAPVNSFENPHPLFLESLDNLDKIENFCNILNYGNDEKVLKFFNENGKELYKINERIKQFRTEACIIIKQRAGA